LHVLTFDISEYETAAILTIKRRKAKKNIGYHLKATNKQAYSVSAAKGELK